MPLRCHCCLSPPVRRAARGFSLVELSLTLLLGSVLSALMLQLLLSEGRSGQKLARLLRERQASARALQLIRAEVQQASRVQIGTDSGLVPACPLGGRQLALRLQTAAGVISYSQGKAPDGIWRGSVLMRCGPAYGLEGELGSGMAQNRVVLDGLASRGGLEIVSAGPAPMTLTLQRRFENGHTQEASMTAPFVAEVTETSQP